MSKKQEILELHNQGKSIEEIVQSGYQKKYIQKVIRENKAKIVEKEECNKNSKNIKKEKNHCECSKEYKILKEEIQLLKSKLEKKVYEEKINISKELGDIKSFVNNLQECKEHIKDIHVEFKITWNKANTEKKK
ncbi:hypothetical protein [Clostridium ganghwense]|uniref:Uncharacterized protein n=1 Tax=Clostridium ganghwense TaxID=312089 RepID=A0ABT4CKC4_9CLOT|nr:hypothetical protein [Clostridium ganghwense]MCY6369503.1 hypothetical protein [Clostridium ganghwense]